MRRDVLLLQGPIGPFFSRFARGLESRGFRVWKINLNGGDQFFYRNERAVDYHGDLGDWEQYLERFLTNRNVGRIYLFGDCRSYHRIAREVAARRGVAVYVFEEGYIRPNYITLEKDGVNGYSPMISSPPDLDLDPGVAPSELSTPRFVFAVTAIYAMLYYMVSFARRKQFPGYKHHRPTGCFSEGLCWLRSGFRKLYLRHRERRLVATLQAAYGDNYFLCPLQVHCDMQVIVHSDFNSIEHFLGEVLTSFAEHAPKNKAIVFKHHPMDRGYTDYAGILERLSAELGLQDRMFYFHDVDLPSLLRNAQGTVLINSTVGLSSIFHGTPVKALGRAVYNIAGLTDQGSLDDFWRSARAVDEECFRRFRVYLTQSNQLNGNFYRRVASGNDTGILWAGLPLTEHTWVEGPVSSEQPGLILLEGGKSAAKQGFGARAA